MMYRSKCLVFSLIFLLLMRGGAGHAMSGQGAAAPLEVIVLGSGGPGATGRASASYIVLIDGVARVLLDAGSGAFVRLGEANLSLAKTDVVLLTHLHIDHAGELAGIFKARAVSGPGPIEFNVWGPGGSRRQNQGAYFPSTTRFLDLLFGAHGAFAYLRDFSAPLRIRAHDISAPAGSEASPLEVYKQDGLTIAAIAGHHGDAPAVIYRIDYAGRNVVFSGDIDAQGIPNLTRIAKGCDLLIFNSVVLDPPDSPAVLYTLHTPPHVIGQVAAAADIHKLLLSHLSPATDQSRDSVLKSIRQTYTGPVSLAEDGMRLQP
jgi:ribonuclease BN (tRNA processing enzyme)